MITVCCVWVRGNVPYGAEYVTRLRSMVRRALPEPHRFVVFTDRPVEAVTACNADAIAIPIAAPVGIPGWWAKIELFSPRWADALGPRAVYLDLDSLVVGDLLSIANHPGELAIVPDGGTFQPRGPLRVVKKYNSSVMAFTSCSRLWPINTECWREVSARLWGDQDWLAEIYPEATLMPAAWFPRVSELNGRDPRGGPAKVVLCKKPKNRQAADELPWVKEVWQ